MSVVHSYIPVVATVLPLVFALLIYLVEHKSWWLRNTLSVMAGLSTFLLVAMSYKTIVAGQVIIAEFPNMMAPLGITFRMDYLGFLAAAVISLIWFLVTVYSTEYMVKEHAKNRFYPFLILALSGAMGVVLSGDLFTFFLFFELMSLTAYVLVVHEETEEAMQAGRRYLVLTIIGGLALFFAIIIIYELMGTVGFQSGGYIAEGSRKAFMAFIGFLIGFGIKAGIVPLHVWLPEAHPVAPSPASALLSGLMLKTGAYGLIRIVHDVFGLELIQATGWNKAMVFFAAVTILLGSAVAITQDDIKRRLAYSSIGQMGYIVLGIGLLHEIALIGAIFHIFAHAFMKSALFLAAGAIIYRTGKRRVSEWAGVGREMVVTMSVFTIAALSMVGIPPLVGFVSKWELSLGALHVGQWGYVLILLLSSLMNFMYYFPVIQKAFFGPVNSSEYASVSTAKLGLELSWKMIVPMVVLASVILMADFFRNPAFSLAEKAAQVFFTFK